MRKYDNARALSVATGALGVLTALTLGAAPAQADPEIPIPPPPAPQLPAEEPIAVQAAASDPAPPAPPAPPEPPAEVPHLASPENLPPGTTDVPLDPPQDRGLSYLRDLWHAMQTQEISGRDALLLLTQRPLDPRAVPPNGMPAGPQAPLPPQAPPAEPAPPESAPAEPAPPESPPPPPVLPELAPPAPAPPELVPPHPAEQPAP